jgi:multiple sugar transport system substrate-binding protein
MGHTKRAVGRQWVSRRGLLGTGATVAAGAALAGTALIRMGMRPAQAAGATLTYMGLESAAFPQVTEQMLAQFERTHPGVRAQFLPAPAGGAGSYHDKLVSVLAAHDGSVDVFDSDVIWQAQWVPAGWVMPLDHAFPPAAQQHYAPAMIWADTYHSHIYGIPWMLDTGHLFYRRDILDQEGLKPATTWQELHDQGVMLHKKYPDMVPFVACYQAGQQLICNFLEYAWSAGGDVLDPKTGTVVFDSPANLQALEMMIRLMKDRVAQPGIVSMDLDTGRTIFTSGKAIYHRNWNYAYADAQQNPTLVGKIGVSAPPHFPGHAPASCAGGWQYVVNAASTHIDEAIELARFMGSPTMQVFKTLHSDFSPAFLPANSDPRVVKRYPFYPELAAQARLARARPKTSAWTHMSTAAEIELTNALIGRKSPRQALKDAQGTIESILAGA